MKKAFPILFFALLAFSALYMFSYYQFNSIKTGRDELPNPHYIHPPETQSYYSLQNKPYTLGSASSFVCCLPKAQLYKEEGLALFENALIMPSTYTSHKRPQDHDLFKKIWLPRLKKIPKTLALVSSEAHNCYYHWMLEVLPRLELLRLSNYSYDLLYLPPLKHAYQIESLNELGVAKERCLQATRTTHLKAKKLIVTSLPTLGTLDKKGLRLSRVPSWIPPFLKSHFLKKELQGPCPEKLYITRKKASKRRILNEEQLMEMLKKEGYIAVALEGLGLSEQARLFNQAKEIIAPHGAGLTNLVFSKPHTKVVELFHPDYSSECYCQLSQLLNLDHMASFGKRAFIGQKERWRYLLFSKDRNKDYIVNVEQIKKIIENTKNV